MAGPVGQPWDAVVVGGGPAGAALALLLDRAGRRVLLIDADGSRKKVCGEGLLPGAWRTLEGLGVAAVLPRAGPIEGISYRLFDPAAGQVTALEARLSGPAFGVERGLLCSAFDTVLERSRVEVLRPAKFRELRLNSERVEVRYQQGHQSRWLSTRFLFGADGLSSTVRRAANLEGARPDGAGRWGARAYFTDPPESTFAGVEVRLGQGLECYRTPLGHGRSGLAFLWSPSRLGRPLPGQGGLYSRLLEALPEPLRAELPSQLEGDERAVGPLRRNVRSPLHPSGRVALLGDAAGYLDAATGQGLCLGLAQAEALAGLLGAEKLSRSSSLLEGRATAAFRAMVVSAYGPLAAYPATVAALRFRHLLAVHGLLYLMDRPDLRLRLFRALAATPGLFQTLLAVAVEEAPLGSLLHPRLFTFARSLMSPSSGPARP